MVRREMRERESERERELSVLLGRRRRRRKCETKRVSVRKVRTTKVLINSPIHYSHANYFHFRLLKVAHSPLTFSSRRSLISSSVTVRVVEHECVGIYY